ncbi:MAG: pyrroloquinoline quinone precursor peptide PqqA [Pirellulales bacterium]|nr:pyrroloquinoline quinone precursor peptide PqqA [Pirellulales bacterium]
MSWTKPDFEELSLCMEVTAYANSEDELPMPAGGDQRLPATQGLTDELPKQ